MKNRLDTADFRNALLLMQAAYLEMPGLKLTLRQGARLWNLPGETCRAGLATLVVTGFLVETLDGAYVRRGAGPSFIAALDSETWTVTPSHAT
jgi:hypothetical protein